MSYFKEIPRLANYVRAYGNVAAPWAGQYVHDPDILVRKRKAKNERIAKLCDLETVKDFLSKHSSYSSNEINEFVTELMVIAKTLAGSESTGLVIEGAVIFLIELLRDCPEIGTKQTEELRRMFGIYPKHLVTKAFELIKECINRLNSDVQEEFIRNGFPRKCEDLMPEEFGSKIKVMPQKPLDETFYLVPFDEQEEEEVTALDKLSFKLNEPQKESKSTLAEIKPLPVAKKFNKDWLQLSLANSADSSVSPSELTVSVCQILKSNGTNEEIQHELVELLGYDRFDLIFQILSHRDEIVYSKVLDVNTKETHENLPPHKTQVVIQSETEKLLTKQLRKDEKKIQQRQNKEIVESDTVLNYKQLKMIREEELLTAKNMPIFNKSPVETFQPSTIYPNVYDQFAVTKMSASFISGRKLALPENHKRINNEIFEEIEIPATAPVEKVVESELIPISSLDGISQKAFENTKYLNRIQSMVFDLAYNTNENMLVCAPTGAGKTNVAMLTILHEIRNNIVNGELQKNQFKIVYVAPMKALAAEVVRNFSSRLSYLKVQVKELTGDMQLTKNEIHETQMLVTTPEKWDVVTRKSTGDVALSKIVKLLILDEVHLLDSDRGHVLEALVARTLRQVETSQLMIRIIGLSATLPNYVDVARFLRVNPKIGLFFFDDRFRPVPLKPTFIGVKASNPLQQIKDMDELCYRKVLKFVRNDHQVMVFVHARNATVRTAEVLRDIARKYNDLELFAPKAGNSRNFHKPKSKQLQDLLENGFAIHHAGMLRYDRNLVEMFFREKYIKVLVCTSTLAWGVNLPARAVIIKGTELYDSKHGRFIDLGVLDVMQIFGRAGRPQYDNKGEGIIMTSHDKLSHYLSLLTRQHQIESKFEERIADNLNAEVALGTVTSIDEGVEWLSYTYFYVRMLRNPHAYGLKPAVVEQDFQLLKHRKDIIQKAALKLDKAQMVRFEPTNGFLHITDLGRTASHFYISTETVICFNSKLSGCFFGDKEIFALVSCAQEFNQLKVRDDELPELDMLLHQCPLIVKYGVENTEGKVNVLLQTYLSRVLIQGFSLISDQAYVVQNATRIIRALFEICLRKKWALLASAFLRVSKMVERRLWDTENVSLSPLHQFSDLSHEVLSKIDKSKLSIEDILEMEPQEVGHQTKCFKERHTIRALAEFIPNLYVDPNVQPITDSILRITLTIKPDFKWSDKHHGSGSENFWIWIEDPETDRIHHSEYFILLKKQVIKHEVQSLVCTIPFPRDTQPAQYLIRVISDRWLGSDRQFAMSFKNLILPQHRQPHTDLLNLQPLPVSVLHNPLYEKLFKFEFFNPIQTQIFHTLYHTDHNVLLGAPTGSGKTIAAEIAMFRVFNVYHGMKVVYIAPLKALVRERIEDWKIRFHQQLKKNVIELTGDVTPDAAAIATADIIVTTPEKWDGVSRSWQTRNYVKDVALIVIDEIHLLGEDRGPVLEVIVSRTNFISAHTNKKIRVVGLSTALANAVDIAKWLGIEDVGLYNFRSSVRPVQLEIHVSGYHGKHYCPRMALMNKPTYQAIKQHSPDKPALVFVSSRRQTRLTSLDLTAYLVAEDDPYQWVHMSNQELQSVIALIRDQNLKLSIAFGIGLHHAGLHEKDRRIVEELFLNQKIQVLIATATLAWGINLPAHLVVIKGTEYFDGKVQRYVDFPITDVMQMAGRAGRPQFDTTGVAVVLVQDIKKDFYKKFLHEPFPVESSLIGVLPDHMNAEIVAGTVTTKQQCLEYLTWTYFFRRLLCNPRYYGLEEIEGPHINAFLSALTDRCLSLLSSAGCITIDEDERSVQPTVLGKITSYYYLNHKTVLVFTGKIHKKATVKEMLQVLCDVHEYAELPVRHNEDILNKDLAKGCRLQDDNFAFDSPHTKANLLFQAHFSRLQLPCSDYYTDLKSVLDQAIRIIQAMIDVCADKGYLGPTLISMVLLQMVLQGRWFDDNTLLTLPHLEKKHLPKIYMLSAHEGEVCRRSVHSLPQLIENVKNHYEKLASFLGDDLSDSEINEIYLTLSMLPMIQVSLSISGWWDSSNCKETKHITIIDSREIKGPTPSFMYTKVHADQEYILTIDLKRLSKWRQDRKAIAPKFPKQKEEGWFLVLGCSQTQELIAMKRVSFISRHSKQQLMFYSPETPGNVKYELYLMSDCYLGLDQQYDIWLEVLEPSIRAQVNSEVHSSSSDDSDSD